METDFRRRLAEQLTLFAVVGITATAFIIHLPHEQKMDHSMLYVFLAALAVLVLAHHLVLLYPSRQGKILPRIPPFFLGLTLYYATACAAVFFSDGPKSPLYYALLPGPVIAGAFFDAGLAVASTSVLAAMYLLAALTSRPFTAQGSQTLFLNILYLYLACFLSTQIAMELRRLEESRREVSSLGDFIRRLEKAKSEYVSMVAHEIRTPLTSIQGFSEMASSADTPPEKRMEYYRIILSESERLSRLVTNLLNLSRIEAGLELNRVPVNIPELINGELDFFRSQTDIHSLEYSGSRAIPTVYADPERLRQVIQNLLSNAIKYSPAGGKVEVTTGLEGKYVTISVRDEGIGIPPEDLPRIFERFSRLEREEVTGISGTGLGLTIVKHLVDLHGGKITARSEPGKGSTFTVYLPIRGGENR
ncbi:ATP-binding protein [Candidatus Solincola tengchongensis]|uniref:sensor histidine kinase n=1 Tax=Candidatus Solincola tengchongensis TaxID=2900693 RepID=UPI00257B1014|nr:ATP-binding protein [Candidatus Solincola tengchongensis]